MKQSNKEIWRLIVCVGAMYVVTAGLFYLAATRQSQLDASLNSVRLVMMFMMMPLLAKYILQLMYSPLYSIVSRLQTNRRKVDEQPSVSVLIPAWNEEVGIVKTIRSVLGTGYPNLQVVVINDGSTDGTHEKVSRFIDEYRKGGNQGATIKYLNLTNGGKARAMNRALVHVTGEIVLTIDADSVMDTDTINNMVKHFNDPNVGAVAGNVIVGNRKKLIEWMQQMEYLYGFFFKRVDSLFNSVYCIGGAAAAYRREVLQEMGGFDHSLITEDIEMSLRILTHGYKTRYAHDAVVYTEGPSDLRGLFNQRLRWTYGRILTLSKHRRLFFSLRQQHNPYLTFLLLPMVVYSDIMLLVAPLMVSAFFAVSILSSDFLPLVVVSAFISSLLGVQVLMDSKAHFHRNLLLIAPVAWILLYAVTAVECQAMFRSLKRLATRKELKWQKWVRVGIIDETCIGGTQPAYD